VLLGALLLVVAYWWWQGRTRPIVVLPEPVSSSPDSSASPSPIGEVTVHVRGKVMRPGVIALPIGSRVIDAIDAAGGMRPGASIGDLNLARLLVDGEQVAVGVRRTVDATGEGVTGVVPTGSAEDAAPGGLLDINTATAGELEALPGIGPVLAGRIVQWRTDNGPFTDIEILGEVSGIGDALMAQLRPLVRAG
jgi:competence protein ComEA